MRAWTTKSILKISCVLALLNTAATCQKHEIKNTKVCTVAGILAAGMDCGNTRSDATSSMTLDETIEFLEPQVASKGKKERPGAMCISADDYVSNKNSLEILCRMLGPQCTYEVLQQIGASARRIDAVSYKAMKKAKK